MRDTYVRNKFKEDNVVRKKIWITEQLGKQICRNDYNEFLELCLLFLGETLPRAERRTTTFRNPDAVHHARWMAKAIYCLKMFLFHEQIELSKDERTGLADVCVFLIRYYLVYWFRCPRPIEKPLQDLTFLKELHVFKADDSDLAHEMILKFINHLWRLSEQNIGFVF